MENALSPIAVTMVILILFQGNMTGIL